MSFTHIWGVFVLTESFRTGTPENDDTPNHMGPYLHYNSFIRAHNTDIPTSIRISQSPYETAFSNGTVAFLFGRLCSQNSSNYKIEAIQIFKCPTYLKNPSNDHNLREALPRVTVVGHVIQEPQILDDGTCLFPVNAVTYVRGEMEAATFITSITPSACWDNHPPAPKAFSAVHITGPIDCVDKRTLLPVITVKDLTLQIGDPRLAELADRNSEILPTAPYNLTADTVHPYLPSTAAVSSIPSYPNPPPVPFETPSWWKENAQKTYPVFEGSQEDLAFILSQPPAAQYLSKYDNSPTNRLTQTSSILGLTSSGTYHTDTQLAGSTSMNIFQSQDENKSQDGSVNLPSTNYHPAPSVRLDADTVYLEDIPIDNPKYVPSPSKKRKRTDSDIGGPSQNNFVNTSGPPYTPSS
ncbi:hypothetical protein M422DRAFT_241135 [Sphaerobolus stellatus SS14]|nr:hypothetical protein M422DRAFT_241135 [Sphaerobolus stellatus SS14]